MHFVIMLISERGHFNLGRPRETIIVIEYGNTAVKPAINRESKKKVQVGNDQEKAQPEKDSHSKNRGGKKSN